MRAVLFGILTLIVVAVSGQETVLDSARFQVSAGANFWTNVGESALQYHSSPGLLLDFLYQDYLGKRDSVKAHSIMEVGLRYNYFRGEYSFEGQSQRVPYDYTQLDLVVGVGGRVFTRPCSEGYLMGGVTAGVSINQGETDFSPTAYLKGGFNYFSHHKKQSHGPYLLITLQDAFFLNDFNYGESWLLVGVNLAYCFRF